MRRSTLLIALTIICISFTAASQMKYESFGKKIDESKVADISQLTSISDVDTLDMKIKATVSEVCQAKGCWMTLESADGTPIRVTFKDYGFFVPKDIAGKEVIVKGIVSKTTLSEEVAKHYAEDAGETFDPQKDYVEYAFVADGVLVSQE